MLSPPLITPQDEIQGKNENPIFLRSRRRLHVVFETGCWLVSLSALAATRHQNRPHRDVSFQPTAQGSPQNSDVCNSRSLRKTPSATAVRLSELANRTFFCVFKGSLTTRMQSISYSAACLAAQRTGSPSLCWQTELAVASDLIVWVTAGAADIILNRSF